VHQIQGIVRSIEALEAVKACDICDAIEAALEGFETRNPFTSINPEGFECSCFEVEIAGMTAVLEEVSYTADDYRAILELEPGRRVEKERCLVDDLIARLEAWVSLEIEMFDDRLRAYPYRDVVLVSFRSEVIWAQGDDECSAADNLLASADYWDHKLIKVSALSDRIKFVSYSVPAGIQFEVGDEELVMQRWGWNSCYFDLIKEEIEEDDEVKEHA
jgi:hypothetical protein